MPPNGRDASTQPAANSRKLEALVEIAADARPRLVRVGLGGEEQVRRPFDVTEWAKA